MITIPESQDVGSERGARRRGRQSRGARRTERTPPLARRGPAQNIGKISAHHYVHDTPVHKKQ